MGKLISDIESRCRVNLSEHALEIIESDLLDFEGDKPTLSGAVSKIFLAYYRHAKHDPDTVAKFLAIKPSVHLKQVPRLQNAVIEALEDDKEYIERDYGKKGYGRCVKSVIEQYADLPYSDRVAAFFSKTIEDIEKAIKDEKRVRLKTANNKWHSVCPYCIDSDKVTAHKYLVGYTKNPDGEDVPSAIRLSRIRKIESNGPSHIVKRQLDDLKEAIKQRGVPFVMDTPTTVRVRLTDKGKSLYSRLTHNRPIYDSKKDDIYVFTCTPTQAEFYFFKFGAEAEIIEPETLRDKFKTLYKDAHSCYE